MSAHAQTPIPDAVAAPGFKAVLSAHAEGAQVYECKQDASGKLAWAFREPIATLLVDGKTVGQHYAGPHWEYMDGSKVMGKTVGNAPGATADDIAWLKLEVTEQHGKGMLKGVKFVQRLNTKGGSAKGACTTAGAFQSVPYSAQYVFLKKG